MNPVARTCTEVEKPSLYSAQYFRQPHLPPLTEPRVPTGITQEEALEKLDWIAAFSEGWDGYDALPIPRRVVNRAQAILRQLVAIPFVSATPDGTIQFEFEDDHGYLEFEIDENELIRMAQTIGENADDWHETLIEDVSVPGIVQDFYAK